MNPMLNFAMNMIKNNPQVANNPMAKEMINVIESGDSKRGEEIANNLCNTYGTSKEQAVSDAKKFFNI